MKCVQAFPDDHDDDTTSYIHLILRERERGEEKRKEKEGYYYGGGACYIYKIRIYFVPKGNFYLDSESNLILCAFSDPCRLCGCVGGSCILT